MSQALYLPISEGPTSDHQFSFMRRVFSVLLAITTIGLILLPTQYFVPWGIVLSIGILASIIGSWIVWWREKKEWEEARREYEDRRKAKYN